MVDAFKNALQSLYTGLCDVYEYQQVKDPVSKITKTQEVQMLTGIKCRLSYQTAPSTDQNESFAKTVQKITLFVDNILDIKAGSKIVVTQNGITEIYKSAGKPMKYTRHQEVSLELWKDKA